MTELSQVGEFALISAITDRLELGDDVRVGPGDDAAVVGLSGSDVVISTDSLVEGVHFRRDWSDAPDVGRKAVAVNVADIEAMGAIPVAVVVALSAPPELPVAWLEALFAGIRAECVDAGVSFVGGDLTRAPQVVIAVTAIGRLTGPAVLRSGARPGETIAARGRLGWAAAGLRTLSRGFRSPRAAVEAYRVPQVPYGAGAAAAAAGATSLIDVSDGLLADLGHVARASGVVCAMRTEAFEVPDTIAAVAAATGVDPLVLVLTGGEDHALVGTFAPGAVPADWWVIGEVRAGVPAVLVDETAWDGEAGWDHFSPALSRRSGGGSR